MTLAQYNAFCKSLPHASHIVQWGGSHVWKVAGKLFAVASFETEGDPPAVTFKCSAMSFEILKQEQGCRPAPYLASRGFLWIQRVNDAGLSDADLKTYLKESHRLAAETLPKKTRKALGLP